MLNGWATKTAAELDATIETWGDMFNHYQIPISAYPELYRRAFDTRQKKMQHGGEVPMMDATLIVSQWTGEHGLEKELREQSKVDPAHRLNEPRTPPPCFTCLGTGKQVFGDRRGEICECEQNN